MENKELARMVLDALENPNNIYHADVVYASHVLMELFQMSRTEFLDKVREML